MSAGLQALRAVIEANSFDAFRPLNRELFLPEEHDAFDHVQRFVDRYDQLPSIEALAEDGIRLTPLTGPLERQIERLRERAAHNAVVSRHQALTDAAGRQDAGAMEATLREMLAGIEAARGGAQAVPSAEAVQRIMEKHGGYSLAQLRDRETGTPTPVIHNLIGEGLSLLSADPKAGKSVFIAQAAVAVVTDRPAFGSLPVHAGPVIFLALEDNDGQFKAKMERMELEWPDGALVFHNWSRIGQGGIEELETMVATLRPRLVLVDTIKKIAPALKASDKRSLQQIEYDELAGLKKLTDQYRGLGIVVVEHTNKAKGGDPIRRTAGSHGKTAIPDNVLLYERTGTQVLVRVRGRNVDEGTVHMTSDPRTWQLSVVGPNVATELRAVDRQVYTWLTDHRGEHRPVDIARGTGLARETVGRALSRLAAMDPPRVDGEGATSTRTYIAQPERVSVFELARRQGRVWGSSGNGVQHAPGGADVPGQEP